MFSVDLATGPQRFYADADRALARKLARCFRQLQTNPLHHNNIRALSGPLAGLHRFRVGDWRVIYRIDHAKSAVHVLDIAHRSNVYE